MAIIPESQELIAEEFEQEQQEMIKKIAEPFNVFVEQVISAVKSNLTFGENFRGTIKTVNFKAAATTATFSYEAKGTPVALWVGKLSPVTDIGSATNPLIMWEPDGKGNIKITSIVGLDATKEYNITFVIVSG